MIPEELRNFPGSGHLLPEFHDPFHWQKKYQDSPAMTWGTIREPSGYQAFSYHQGKHWQEPRSDGRGITWLYL